MSDKPFVPLHGTKFLAALVAALDLKGRAVRRVVLDVDIHKPVKVYVEEFLNGDSSHFDSLAAELPHVAPFVQFVDRVETTAVAPDDGAAVEVKQVRCADDEGRELCLKVLDVLKYGGEAQREQLRRAVYAAGSL